MGSGLAAREMRWIVEFAGYVRPIGGDTRVAVIFRRRYGAWRFIQHVEATLAPIAYFRRSHERFAAIPPGDT